MRYEVKINLVSKIYFATNDRSEKKKLVQNVTIRRILNSLLEANLLFEAIESKSITQPRTLAVHEVQDT